MRLLFENSEIYSSSSLEMNQTMRLLRKQNEERNNVGMTCQNPLCLAILFDFLRCYVVLCRLLSFAGYRALEEGERAVPLVIHEQIRRDEGKGEAEHLQGGRCAVEPPERPR